MISDKKILLGVCGGIAAYKSCEVVRQLVKEGAEVRVVMTRAATEFITPLTMETLSRHHVTTGTFPSQDPSITGTHHIEIARWPDLMLIAPATANVLGKIANGIADDALSTIAMACPRPILVAPAMNDQMWNSPFVRRNLDVLRSNGIQFVDPEFGHLAEGYEGMGRLAEPARIVWAAEKIVCGSEELRAKKVLVTAGPTQEAIDPVRYLTNASSGKMGFAVAREASLMGAEVTLVSGPVRLDEPYDVAYHRVRSAAEMHDAVHRLFPEHDMLIMTAAVADFRPENVSPHKIKKSTADLSLDLTPTVDILASLEKRQNQVVIGFALETSQEMENARHKLTSKNLDFVVLNNPLKEGAGFDGETNIVTIVEGGRVTELPLMPKTRVARQILERAAALLHV